MKLYDLKNMMISQLINADKMNVVGYHEQESYDGKINYLMLVELAGYTFHVPIGKDETKKLKLLGEIGVIKAEKTLETKLKYSEAICLLKGYAN